MKTCPICGKPIPDKRKYCSPKCYHRSPTKGRPPRKPRNPCLVCGKPVARAKQKFCSLECYAKYWKGKKKPQAYRRITKICPICGKQFITGGRAGHKEKIYCSLKCLHIAQRKPLSNMAFYRSAQWRELRLKIIERDKFKCQFCGKDGTIKTLQVHHIIPTNIKLNFEENNLITCCRKCHSTIDSATQLGYRNNQNFDPFSLVSLLKIK